VAHKLHFGQEIPSPNSGFIVILQKNRNKIGFNSEFIVNIATYTDTKGIVFMGLFQFLKGELL
jgi:hypothetical protein